MTICSSPPAFTLSSITPRVKESSSTNGPTPVRTRPAIAAPHPNRLPISWQSVRIYVPFEQVTSITNSLVSGKNSVISMEYTVIFRFFLSTSTPCLASS